MKIAVLSLVWFTVLLSAAVPARAQIQYLTPWWTATGTTSDTCALGSSIAGLGDINGDGYDDFAASTEEERIWIFEGSQQPDSVPDLFISSPDTSVDYFGWRLWDIGDVNGDASPDLLVAARAQIYPYLEKLFLYFAGAAFDTLPDLIIGPPEIEKAQIACGIGDFNGDGDNDFAIIDNDYQVPGTLYFGRMEIFFGGAVLDSLPDWEINAGPDRDRFPMWCTGLGDLDGNGSTEVAASSGVCTGPGALDDAGLVEIYYGGNPPDTIPNFRQYGDEYRERFGDNLIALDFDGDSNMEMGVYSQQDFPPNYGSAIIFYNLIPQPDTIPDYFIGNNGIYPLGALPTVIDFNADGAPDLATGGAGSGFGEGGVNVYLGGVGFDPLIDLRCNGNEPDAHLGAGFGNIGDFNADGIEDLAAGEPGFLTFMNWPKWGRVHVLLGDSSFHQSVGVAPGEAAPPVPSVLQLSIFPIPANPFTVISCQLPVASNISLQVFDISGRKLVELASGFHLPGEYRYVWDASGRAAGMYFVRLTAGQERIIEKVVMIK